MKNFKKQFVWLAVFLFFLPLQALADHDDVALFAEKVSFPEYMLEGKKYRFYATTTNLGTEDVKGVTRFFAFSEQLGADQPVSVVAGKEDTVFIDAELPAGTHQVLIKFIPFDSQHDNPGNNAVTKSVAVIGDADRDGKPNDTDSDDDNDGVLDSEDAFPLDRKEQKDTDGDGKGDNRDEDDDNDGVLDETDAAPLDSSESKDTDKDKVADKFDAFPNNAKEQKDTDKDGKGDNSDQDADNDGIPKGTDVNDVNRGPEIILSSLPAFPMIKQRVVLDASLIRDPDGEVRNITALIKAPKDPATKIITLSKEKKIELELKEPGAYEITITAEDDKGETRDRVLRFKVRTPLFYMSALFIGLLAAVLAIFGILTYSSRRKRKFKGLKRFLKRFYL